MKVKVLFVLLNVILIGAIALVFTLLFTSASFFSENGGFRAFLDNAPPAVFILAASCAFFFALLVAVDVFFVRHLRTFELLAAENWPALARELETATLSRGSLSRMNVSMLTEVLVLLSDYETLRKLFAKLKAERPALYRDFAPDYTAASIVFGNLDEAESCVNFALSAGGREASRDKARSCWLDFYAAFIAMRRKDFAGALKGFTALASDAQDLIVAALSAYFCSEVIPGKTFGIGVGELQNKASVAALSAKSRVLKVCSMEKWNKLCAVSRKKVRAAVIAKTLIDVRSWLFPANFDSPA